MNNLSQVILLLGKSGFFEYWGKLKSKMASDNLQLEFERIRILFGSISGIVTGVISLTLFMGVYLSATQPASLVWIWVPVTLASIVPRTLVFYLFFRGIQTQQITPENVLPWERRWIYTTIPLMVAFASLTFLPFGTEQELLAITLFLSVLCTGSILTSNTSLKTLVVSNSIVLLPLMVRLFMEQTVFFTLLGGFLVATTILFGNFAIRVNRALMENIQLKIDNENISLTDQLTNLWNRRGLYFYVEKLIPRALRSREPFTIIMLDIDHFKKFNDTHGHNAGDVELARVATCIEQETRDEDLVVRYGGEEFMVVLPATSMDQTKEVAKRICRNVRENSGVTISGGLAVFTHEIDFRQLVNQADKALYAAKAAGRDRFVFA